MKNLKIYQVDAFTDKVFSGNPAAICPLGEWLEEDQMQKIAMENNLSETAFFVKNNGHYDIRWFTPEAEIDLCGHATLASAHVILNYLGSQANKVDFQCKVGALNVLNKDGLLEMDFPSNPPQPIPIPGGTAEALGAQPVETFSKSFCIAVFENESTVKNLKPDFNALEKLDHHLVIATAPGNNVDFVSRVFAPKVGINEDPVTGSAHTELIPLWSEKLNKTQLTARQVSSRGGDLYCELAGDRVKMSGKAVLYMIGEIYI